MKNELYRLSPLYRLVPKEEINTIDITDIEDIINGKKFVLLQVEKYQTYLINPAIHEFLQLFTQPITKPDIVVHYINEYQTTREEILPLLQSFFTEMLEQNIIVTEEEYTLIEEDAQRSDVAIQTQLELVQQDFILQKTLLSEYPLMMYVAIRKSDNKTVVLKILIQNPRFSKDFITEKKAQILQERHLLKRFAGTSNILQLENIPQYKGLTINAYEYINGLPLFSYIKQNELDLNARWQLIKAITAAFAQLHKANVLHGDIHDGNVLVTPGGKVKVIDFDMAFSSDDAEAQKIRYGGMNGFIAPEKISYNFLDMVHEQPDFQSEVYQIGVLCYFCIYEEMPFEADTWKQLVEKVLFKNVKLHKKNKNNIPIDKTVSDLVGIALSKDKHFRYKSAKQMHEIFNDLEFEINP